jgi:hypothetical protein
VRVWRQHGRLQADIEAQVEARRAQEAAKESKTRSVHIQAHMVYRWYFLLPAEAAWDTWRDAVRESKWIMQVDTVKRKAEEDVVNATVLIHAIVIPLLTMFYAISTLMHPVFTPF